MNIDISYAGELGRGTDARDPQAESPHSTDDKLFFCFKSCASTHVLGPGPASIHSIENTLSLERTHSTEATDLGESNGPVGVDLGAGLLVVDIVEGVADIPAQHTVLVISTYCESLRQIPAPQQPGNRVLREPPSWWTDSVSGARGCSCAPRAR